MNLAPQAKTREKGIAGEKGFSGKYTVAKQLERSSVVLTFAVCLVRVLSVYELVLRAFFAELGKASFSTTIAFSL